MNEIAFVLKPPLNRRIISSNSNINNNNSHSSLNTTLHNCILTPCHIHSRRWAELAPLPPLRPVNAAH